MFKMKNLLIILAVILLVGCERNEVEPVKKLVPNDTTNVVVKPPIDIDTSNIDTNDVTKPPIEKPMLYEVTYEFSYKATYAKFYCLDSLGNSFIEKFGNSLSPVTSDTTSVSFFAQADDSLMVRINYFTDYEVRDHSHFAAASIFINDSLVEYGILASDFREETITHTIGK